VFRSKDDNSTEYDAGCKMKDFKRTVEISKDMTLKIEGNGVYSPSACGYGILEDEGAAEVCLECLFVDGLELNVEKEADAKEPWIKLADINL